jgi:hypothetical protein
MPVEFNEKDFDEQQLSCDKCQWTGKGADAILIDLYGVVSDKEVHCPKCDTRLGILKKGEGPPGESATDLSFQFG